MVLLLGLVALALLSPPDARAQTNQCVDASGNPTPGTCPDMLQGQRIIAGGDWFALDNTFSASGGTEVSRRIYATTQGTTIPQLASTSQTGSASSVAPCFPTQGPFPQHTRLARLFNTQNDMEVTLLPNADDTGALNSDCTGTQSSVNNLQFQIRDNLDTGNNTRPPLTNSGGTPRRVDPRWTQLAVADFDFDGFDDIFFMSAEGAQVYSAKNTSNPKDGLAGHDLADFATAGSQAPINEPTTGDFNGDGLLDVAWIGGDFLTPSGSLSVFFATVCPGSVPGTICAGKNKFAIILDPAATLFPSVSGATSTIVLADAPLTTQSNCGASSSSTPVFFEKGGGDGRYRNGAVVLGNFEDSGFAPNGAPIDELMVVYVSGNNGDDKDQKSDKCRINLNYYTFTPPTTAAPSWAQNPNGASVTDLVADGVFWFEVGAANVDQMPLIQLYAQAAPLDWYGTTEQGVIVVGGIREGKFNDSTGAFDPEAFDIPMTVAVGKNGDQTILTACEGPTDTQDSSDPEGTPPPTVLGMAVGRFATSTTVAMITDSDTQQQVSACGDFKDAKPGDCPYNPWLAIFKGPQSGGGGGAQIRFISFSGTGSCGNSPTGTVQYFPAFHSASSMDNWDPVVSLATRAGSLLRSGDVAGLSTRVGTPEITRVTGHTQPQLVTQAPPALIDYILPSAADSTTDAIVNFTRAPTTFNTQIDFSTTSMTTASTQATASYSTGFKESIGGEAKFGAPLVSSIDIKNTESWSQQFEHNTSTQLSTYQSTSLDTSTAAGADDQVWWTQTSFNVFNYPVIGQTTCPASLTCDASDPTQIVCPGSATTSQVTLTCAPTSSGGGCQCLSPNGSASLCPAPPSNATERACQADASGDVCCAQLRQPLFMTLSGPEEKIRNSADGAGIEWYQPKHEPGQILSYPSSLALIQNRQANAQALGQLDAFTTGVNTGHETIAWTCSTTSETSVGTTTTHSFDSDTSITAGTPNLSEAEGGVNVTAEFDYNQSDAHSTLNTHTVGQTASSSVTLNLAGSNFLNSTQYEYEVAGLILGATNPSVIDTRDLKVCPPDNTDCSSAEQVQADCTTTGPLTVAYAADPTTAGGLWWQSVSPYRQQFDVALNNPSRWTNVNPDQVENTDLQCRGDQLSSNDCFTVNQPQGVTASDVWDTEFYSMKGLLVTLGGTAGPQRDLATVGDEIFLQVRVYNYSLKAMESGTQVYARIYRQQVVVDTTEGDIAVVGYATDPNGNPLPAQPVGPTGLGDSDPIPVRSPKDGTATIPPFNVTDDPSQDNISLATTSYVASADDTCEEVNGVKTCDVAYYVYWVTVWTEDANGNVLFNELTGHNLGSTFKRDTLYDFITGVPLETVTIGTVIKTSLTFTNNVGMYKKVFSIVPADQTVAGGQDAAGFPPIPIFVSLPSAKLRIDNLRVFPKKVAVGERALVTAQITSVDAPTRGATVVVSDGVAQAGGRAIDAEWLPYIRANGTHFVRVPFRPTSCGLHTIVVEAVGGQASKVQASVDVEVLGWPTTERDGEPLDPRTAKPCSRKQRAAPSSGPPSSNVAANED
jgi:hypothetical protein